MGGWLLAKTTRSASDPSSLMRLRLQPVELTSILRGFSQEPLTERDDLWQPGHRLGADDPVRVGNGHRDIERTHKPAADQIPCGKRRAREGDPLAVDRGIDRHACLVEDRAACRVHAVDAGKVEPLAPAL